jgi:hypothetical protein
MILISSYYYSIESNVEVYQPKRQQNSQRFAKITTKCVVGCCAVVVCFCFALFFAGLHNLHGGDGQLQDAAAKGVNSQLSVLM